MLVEEGKVALDDPISKYIGESPGAWRGVTVRHLLTHTSGLYTRFKTRIAHGFISASLISTLVGCRLPGPGALYVNQQMSFRKPVFLGDTVNARAIVRKLIREKNFVELETTCEVDGEIVIDGFATTWVPSR